MSHIYFFFSNVLNYWAWKNWKKDNISWWIQRRPSKDLKIKKNDKQQDVIKTRDKYK